MKITIFILIILLFFLIINQENKKIEHFLSYKKCDKYKISDNLKLFLDNYNINKSFSNDSGLWIPCGYRTAENQLIKLIPNNENQLIFAISGHDQLAGKNYLFDIIRNYYGIKMASNIIPMTYLLNNKNDMINFKNNFDKNELYILKKNIQNKKGLLITNNLSEILNAYKDNFKIVQIFLKDVYRINKRKLNFRIYLLIICEPNKKLKFYVSKLGKILYTNKNYNNNDRDWQQNITSHNLDPVIYDQNPQDLRDFENFIGKNKYISFFNQIINLINLTMKAVSFKICNLENIKNNTSFQLFGLDFIANKKLSLKLLEINKGPSMIPVNRKDEIMKNKITSDIFELLNLIKYNNNKMNDFILINK